MDNVRWTRFCTLLALPAHLEWLRRLSSEEALARFQACRDIAGDAEVGVWLDATGVHDLARIAIAEMERLRNERDLLLDVLDEHDVVRCSECQAWHSFNKLDDFGQCQCCASILIADQQRADDDAGYNRIVREGLGRDAFRGPR